LHVPSSQRSAALAQLKAGGYTVVAQTQEATGVYRLVVRCR
jgi:hypothetical protein